MLLEFLQTEDDIGPFVDYLYDNGLVLSYGRGRLPRVTLDRESAKGEMVCGLILGESFFALGREEAPLLVQIDTCGPRSHPQHLKITGRSPGSVITYSKESDALKLFGWLKTYFRKNYTLHRGDCGSRINLYFGPGYQELDAVWETKEKPKELCRGYVFLRSEKEIFCDLCHRTEEILFCQDGITVAGKAWKNSLSSDTEKIFFVDILWDPKLFSEEAVKELGKKLACEESRHLMERSERRIEFQAPPHKYGVTGPAWYTAVRITHYESRDRSE